MMCVDVCDNDDYAEICDIAMIEDKEKYIA